MRKKTYQQRVIELGDQALASIKKAGQTVQSAPKSKQRTLALNPLLDAHHYLANALQILYHHWGIDE